MEKYGVNELRKMFLDFMESKGHLIMKSFSLVPHNDNSLLLINAGMAPLKPYFTGAEIPPRRRVSTCQKCIRTGDLDNVGHTARHGTFFEMLGNFSFGDYFKTEAIHWTWEFLTEVVGLDPNRLYPSVYENDDEAFAIWRDEIGIPENRIYRFGKADNFWEHGAGPCGPCSEVYYDRGEKYMTDETDTEPGGEGDRFMEIWNDVFTQFENDGKGNYTTLKQKNIDTGMGLERLAVAVQDVDSMFDIDTIRALRDHVCRLAHKEYHVEHNVDVDVRKITDHARASTFMISDGIMPSNEGRGYVLRRLIRRAAMAGRRLGIEGAFMAELAKTVIETSADGYPELRENEVMILEVLNKEEETFGRTIDQGLRILGELEEEMAAKNEKTLSGDKAFLLYDTYGFPLDLTTEILKEKGYEVDEEGFKAAMQEQRERARGARKTTNYSGKELTIYDELDPTVTSVFTGYDRLTDQGTVKILTTEVTEENRGEVVQALADGSRGTIITDITPFYATMGGQVGDTGFICTDSAEFKVEKTEPLLGGKVAHMGVVTKGMIKTGDKVTLKVDEAGRLATEKNHSGTHLLQKALKLVLGDHVAQKGSYVSPDRLRFDFVHFKAMSKEEIAKVEDIVNEEIRRSIPVRTDVMTIDEARKTGAMALFGEKYGEKVRVVSMGDFSKEFCGGTHVANTGEIQAFKIVGESGVAAGVRRIEALTGANVFAYYRNVEDTLLEVAGVLKSTPKDAAEHARKLENEIRALKSEIESMKAKAAQESLGDAASDAEDVKGVSFVAKALKGVDVNGLRELGDSLKEKLGDCVIVLASENADKVNLLVMASDSAVKKGAHAGNIIREAARVVGGGGGGRPNMAQAGGKNAAKIGDALLKAKEVLAGQLS
ncbi:MAG: alanine--tRNA ligase [Lachnospiraceae bacterium]|nr:alanine--tRNA ligase [Lachnospiraceae bacterium]